MSESIALKDGGSSTVWLAIGLMAVVIMMVLPMPPLMLDIGLMLSFGFAILIFTVTLFVARPLEFSSFPSILLISLLLRLSLNISSTKLIIGEGHTGTAAAGGVIEGFAMFIMGGNLAIGLIVFSVLVIVNFLVITKGAGRMAEVGARFALDAMPGKQMAIDADVAAGAITHGEAQRRRDREQQETAFLGSLDGASKFVKGDAVAGLLITGLNLVAGIIIGMLVHGVDLGTALQNYSVLTVGDGLVSQIPAVIISIAAALLLSKGRGESAVDSALISELGARPEALLTVAAALAVFGLFPGLPLLPFLAGSAALGWAAYRVRARRAVTVPVAIEPEQETQPRKQNFGDLLYLDEIHVLLSPDLAGLLIGGEGDFENRVEKIRRYIVTEFGFVMPPVRVTDALHGEKSKYEINMYGVRVTQSELRVGKYLALVGQEQYPDIQGETVKEPVYGAPARWVGLSDKNRLIADGCTVVDPVEVLSTHLLETVQSRFGMLLTQRALRELLDAFASPSDEAVAETNKRLVDDIVPDRVSYDTLLTVLRDLLTERVSIRNIGLILESLQEAQNAGMPMDVAIEHTRRRMAFQLVSRYTDENNTIVGVTLSSRWDDSFNQSGKGDEGSGPYQLEEVSPEAGRALAEAIKNQYNAFEVTQGEPVIVVTAARRRSVRTVISAHGLNKRVLSFEEINGHATLRTVAQI